MKPEQIILDAVVEIRKEQSTDLFPGLRFEEDLGFDSLDMVELAIIIEEKTDLEFEDADLEKMKTIGDAVRMIERRRNETDKD